MRLYQHSQGRVPDALAAKYTNEPGRYWERFYQRNADRFYKDRHYFEHEWPQLLGRALTLLEVGCGVGNTVYPLLELNPALTIYACDLSATAVALVCAHPSHAAGRVTAFVGDITAVCSSSCTAADDAPCSTGSGQYDDQAAVAAAAAAPLPVPAAAAAARSNGHASKLKGAQPLALSAVVPAASVDYCTMVFVLSAVAPEKQAQALLNVARCLRPGSGRVLFRDYADGDMAQTRLHARGEANAMISESFYVRGDGTCCYYFTEEGLRGMFGACGFVCEELCVVERSVENRKRCITMERRWIQGTFRLLAPEEAAPPPPQPQQQQQQQAQQQQAQQQRPAPVHADACSPGPLTGWLSGAAGRLAQATRALPGTSSGRALLPESLDSADEEASAISPARQRRSSWSAASPPAASFGISSDGAAASGQGRHGSDSMGYCAADAASTVEATSGSGAAGAARMPVEALLDAEFFGIVGRDTAAVVAEEVAAAAPRVAPPVQLFGVIGSSGRYDTASTKRGGACVPAEASTSASVAGAPAAAIEQQQKQQQQQPGCDGGSSWWPVHVGGVTWQCAAESAATLAPAALLAQHLAAAPELTQQQNVLVLGDGSGGAALLALVAAKRARRVVLAGGPCTFSGQQPQQATVERNSHLIVAERVRCIPSSGAGSRGFGVVGAPHVERLHGACSGRYGLVAAVLSSGNNCGEAAVSAMQVAAAMCSSSSASSSGSSSTPLLLLCVPVEHAETVLLAASERGFALAVGQPEKAAATHHLITLLQRRSSLE